MNKSEVDYLNCEPPFKNEFDLNQHKHSRGINLSIDLPTSHQDSKFLTPVVANFLNYNSYNDEFKNQSPILCKESSTNPFEETFRQAALNPFKQTNFDNQNTEIDNNESLNTPSIDLKYLESIPKKLVANNQFNQNGSCSKLDLLISASDEQIFNTFDDNLKNNSDQISQFDDSEDDDEKQNFKIDTSVKQQIKTTKRVLPKLDSNSNEIPAYKIFVKCPDGSSLDLSSAPTTPTILAQNYSQPSTKIVNIQMDGDLNSNSTHSFDESASIEKNYSDKSNKTLPRTGRKRKTCTKKTSVDPNIETTTLKSIKSALSESTSQLNPSLCSSTTTEIMKCDSFCSQSSQSSTTSSYYGLSSKDSLNDNSSYLDLVTSSASNSQSSSVNGKTTDVNNKSKPGRRSKNEPKEDPKEKKIRSLERNREAASRCRTKRKRWINALEEKADELEQQNKELRTTYDDLKREVALLRLKLTNSMDKVTTTTVTTNNLSDISTNKIIASTVDNSSIDQPNQTFKTTINSNLFDALLQVAKNSETNQH